MSAIAVFLLLLVVAIGGVYIYRTLQAKNDFIKALQVLQRRLIETKTDLPRETKNLDTVDDPDQETTDDNKDNDGDDTKDWYLLGSYLTLADIVIVATLIYPFQMAFNKDYFVQQLQQPEQPQQVGSLKAVVEWFERCVQRPEFQAVLGTVEIGSKLATASSSSPTVEPTVTTASSAFQWVNE